MFLPDFVGLVYGYEVVLIVVYHLNSDFGILIMKLGRASLIVPVVHRFFTMKICCCRGHRMTRLKLKGHAWLSKLREGLCFEKGSRWVLNKRMC